MTIVDENHAPGRKRMVRANGRVNAYWVASPAAVKAGYRPKTIPLNDDRGDVVATPEIAARCRALWAEMLEFMAGAERGPSRSQRLPAMSTSTRPTSTARIVASGRPRSRAVTGRWPSCGRPSASVELTP